MRFVKGVTAIFVILLLCTGVNAAGLSIEPDEYAIGQPMLVRVALDRPAKSVRVDFIGRSYDLIRTGDKTFEGFAGVDLRDKPGKHVIRAYADDQQVAAARIKVESRDYGVRKITVAKKFMSLTPAQLARYKREIAQIKKVYKSRTDKDWWAMGAVSPINSRVVSRFGRRSIVNGVEKSPHSGVDLKGATGTPVRAAAKGKVALVLDTFFGGLTVMLDHGHGIITSYLHLSRAMVKKGQMVSAGQVIGRVGQSGRVTGPHLHFGVKLAGASVDPLAWVKYCKKIAIENGW